MNFFFMNKMGGISLHTAAPPTYAVIGGDLRLTWLAWLLAREGCQVYAYGLAPFAPSEALPMPDTLRHVSSLEAATKSADCWILPIPLQQDCFVCGDGLRSTLPLDELLPLLRHGITLFAGGIPKQLQERADQCGAICHDILADPFTACQNTIATVEGLLAETILHYPGNLTNSRCLVFGCGRCGTTLIHYLHRFGCSLRIYDPDRNAAARASILTKPPETEETLPEALHWADLIFNTAPAPILRGELLSHVRRESRIFDLTRPPCGISEEQSRLFHLQTMRLPGLPGRVAPLASAQILLDFIHNQPLCSVDGR